MHRLVLKFAALFAIYAIVCIPAANAQSSPSAPAVLELYTSQGCSSCPSADKLLKSYAKRDDIVALSFNVDYWDYLGWKDTLANPAYSKRQRLYARTRGDGAVYTPQILSLIHI